MNLFFNINNLKKMLKFNVESKMKKIEKKDKKVRKPSKQLQIKIKHNKLR